MNRFTHIRNLTAGSMLLGMLSLTGCHVDMWRQPKIHNPQRENPFFEDGVSMRHPPQGTIARGRVHDDEELYEGTTGGGKYLVTELPASVLASFKGTTEQERRLAMLKRGQERFNIYCTPCHGKLGDGNGMIAQRGFALRRPPGNYHTDRLRKMPIGHFYDVIVNGYGTMYSYASRIQEVNDRWAIASYVRALQLSQNATMNDVPEAERANVEAAPAGEHSGSSERQPGTESGSTPVPQSGTSEAPH